MPSTETTDKTNRVTFETTPTLFPRPVELSLPVQRYSDDEEFTAKELEDLGLEHAVHLFGPFIIYKSVYDKLVNAFESVVFVSLFTKFYGRLAIIAGIIPKAAAVSFGAFLLTNLLFGAGPVALIAGIIRFIYVLVKDLRAGKDWSEALKHASEEALKTAIKFFIVYMIWVLAIAALTPAGLLSGGLLPLGILIVGVVVCLGFLLASFLTDKLPGLLKAPEKSWASFKEKILELKGGILAALLEGFSWTLMDNDLVNISGHITGFLGKAIDLVGVSLIVSGLFFLGAVIFNTIDHQREINQRKKVSSEDEEKIQNVIREAQDGKVSAQTTLTKIKDIYHNPKLQSATAEYIKTIVILGVITKLQKNAAFKQATFLDTLMTEHERSWFRISHASLSASSGQLTLLSSPQGSTDLERLEQISNGLSSKSEFMRTNATQDLTRLKSVTNQRSKKAFKELQNLNVFATKNGTVYSHSKGNSSLTLSPGFGDVAPSESRTKSGAGSKKSSVTLSPGFGGIAPPSLMESILSLGFTASRKESSASPKKSSVTLSRGFGQ